MRRLAILLALVAATTLLAAGVAFTQTSESEDADPYIVVLESGVDDPSRVAEGIEGRQEGLEVGFVYSNALEGFSAEIPDDSVDEVRNNPQVDYVERDGIVKAQVQTLPWSVDRIGADESSTEAGNGSGAVEGVNAYIIDTGIDKRHDDLNVVEHVNFHGSSRNNDCDGHGTHVAGTLAAEDDTDGVAGVAPGAPLTGVKVLGCDGSGRVSKVIKGVDWVTDNAKTPAVANMSLAGGASVALDEAVQRSAASGVFYSVSAGNDNRNACRQSPARAGAGTNGIVTTAGTKRSGEELPYSNFGPCVDIWAPGKSILSTKLGGGTTTSSGTSAAASHVGGTGALYLSNNTRATSIEVESALKAQAEPTGAMSDGGTPVLLVDASEF